MWVLLVGVFGAGSERAGELREPQYNEGLCRDPGSSGGARFLVRSWRTKRPGTEMNVSTAEARVWEREREKRGPG